MTDSHYDCNSLLIVLSGPSGVGKDAVLNKMREDPGNYHFTVTATTREMRGKKRLQGKIIFSYPVLSLKIWLTKKDLWNGPRCTVTFTAFLNLK